MENKKELRRARMRALLVASLSIIALLSFVYGQVNNIVAKKEKESALQTMIQLEECRKRSEDMNQQLVFSLEEARKAKDFALGKSKAAEELSKKSTSSKYV